MTVCDEWLASVQTDKLGRSSLLLQLLYLSHTDSLRDADICHLAHTLLPESNCRVRLPWRELVTGGHVSGEGANQLNAIEIAQQHELESRPLD